MPRVQDLRGRWGGAALVVAVAAAVQGLYLLDLGDDPTFATPIIDARTYFDQACAAARGESLAEGAFWQPPLFPFLMGLVFRVTGPNLWAARSLLGLIFVACCFLTYRLGRRLFGGWVGVLAGGGLALYGPFLFFSQELLPTSTAALLNLATLNLLVSAVRSRRPSSWVAVGLCSGLAVLNVPNAVMLLVTGWFAAFRRPRRSNSVGGHANPRQRIRAAPAALLALAGFLTAVLPVSIRNFRASGEWVWVATNGGINFYIGNNAEVHRTLAIRPGAEWDRLVRAPLLEGVRKHGAQSAWFIRRTLAWAGNEPVAFVTGLLRKTYEFLHSRELPRNTDVYAARAYSWVLSGLVWRAGPVGFPWALAAPLAVYGLGSLRATARGHQAAILRGLPMVFVVLYAASIIAVFVSSRYRAPVIPFVLIFAAAGAVRLVRRPPRARPSRSRPAVAFAAALGMLVVACLPLHHPTDPVNFLAEMWYHVGTEHLTLGEHDKAEFAFKEALSHDAQFAPAMIELGHAALRRRDADTAQGWLEKAAAAAPQSPETLRLSGDIAAARGQFEEAEGYYQKAVETSPTYTPGYVVLAELCLHLGRHEEAESWLRKALDFADRSGRAPVLLGDLLASRGQYAEAILYYRRGIAWMPPDPAVLNRVAWLLATCPDRSLRDGVTAVNLAEAALRMTGEDTAILNTLSAAYLQAGRRRDAVRALERGASLADAQGDGELARSMRERLERLRESHNDGR